MLSKLEQEIMWTLKDMKGFHTTVSSDNTVHAFFAEPANFESAYELANKLIAKARAMYTNEELRISRDTWAGMGEVQWMNFNRTYWNGNWDSRWEVRYSDSEAGVPSVWVSFHFRERIKEMYLSVKLNIYD